MTRDCLILLTVITPGGDMQWHKIPVQPAVIERVEAYSEKIWDGSRIQARVHLKQLDSSVKPEPLYVRESPTSIRRLPCKPFAGE